MLLTTFSRSLRSLLIIPAGMLLFSQPALAFLSSVTPVTVVESNDTAQYFLRSRRAISDDGNIVAYIERKTTDDFPFPYEDLVVEDQAQHIKLYVTSQNYSWMTAPPEISYFELSADGRSIIFMTDSVLPIPVFWHIPSSGLARTDYHKGVTNLYHAELRDTNNNLSLQRVDRINTSMQDRSAGGCLVDTSEGVHCYGNDSSVSDASNSADGRFVVFASRATNLLPGLDDGYSKIYLYDTQTRQLSAPIRHCANTEQFSPTISKDGQRIAFEQMSDDPTCFGPYSALLWDAQGSELNQLTLISHTAQGGSANGANFSPRISSDGQSVAFASRSTDLANSVVVGVNNSAIYRWRAGAIEPVSQYRDGTTTFKFLHEALGPSISAHGDWISFVSASPDMTPCAPNVLPQLYRWDSRSNMIATHGLGTIEADITKPQGPILAGTMSDNGQWSLTMRVRDAGNFAIDKEAGYGHDFDGQAHSSESATLTCSATITPFRTWCATHPGKIGIWTYPSQAISLQQNSQQTVTAGLAVGVTLGTEYPEYLRGIRTNYPFDDLAINVNWLSGQASLKAERETVPGSYTWGAGFTDYCGANTTSNSTVMIEAASGAPETPELSLILVRAVNNDSKTLDVTYVFSNIDSAAFVRLRIPHGLDLKAVGANEDPTLSPVTQIQLDPPLGAQSAATFRLQSFKPLLAQRNGRATLSSALPGVQAVNAQGGSALATSTHVIVQ